MRSRCDNIIFFINNYFSITMSDERTPSTLAEMKAVREAVLPKDTVVTVGMKPGAAEVVIYQNGTNNKSLFPRHYNMGSKKN